MVVLLVLFALLLMLVLVSLYAPVSLWFVCCLSCCCCIFFGQRRSDCDTSGDVDAASGTGVHGWMIALAVHQLTRFR